MIHLRVLLVQDPGYWHLVTTSLASDTGQRDGHSQIPRYDDVQAPNITTITTDSELTIPGFRERAQDAQSSVNNQVNRQGSVRAITKP